MLQEKKANMINGTINNDKVAMEKLTPEDMQFLFRKLIYRTMMQNANAPQVALEAPLRQTRTTRNAFFL